MRYDLKRIFVFTQSTCYSCTILKDLKFSRQILENHQISNFIKISAVRDEMSMQTDRHYEVNNRFMEFCERKYIGEEVTPFKNCLFPFIKYEF
jgi:hypothetical protein